MSPGRAVPSTMVPVGRVPPRSGTAEGAVRPVCGPVGEFRGAGSGGLLSARSEAVGGREETGGAAVRLLLSTEERVTAQTRAAAPGARPSGDICRKRTCRPASYASLGTSLGTGRSIRQAESVNSAALRLRHGLGVTCRLDDKRTRALGQAAVTLTGGQRPGAGSAGTSLCLSGRAWLGTGSHPTVQGGASPLRPSF